MSDPQEELDRINEQLDLIEERKELAIRGNHNYVIHFAGAPSARGLDSRDIGVVWDSLPLGRGQLLQGVPDLFNFGAVYGDGSKVVSIGFVIEESEQEQEYSYVPDPQVPTIPTIQHPMLD